MKQNNLTAFFERHGIPVCDIEVGYFGYADPKQITACFGLFDRFALGVYPEKDGTFRFVRLKYPAIRDINENENMRDEIIAYCFAGRAPDNYEVQLQDIAMKYGETDWIFQREFENAILSGLTGKGKCPKHLHFFNNESHFLDALDGRIYGVADSNGKFVCDIHEDQFIEMTDNGTLIDSNENWDFEVPEHSEADVYLADEAMWLHVYNRRIEVIIMQ